ncbi:hypothetical protein SNE40_000269 [Patella caerulea]|uniref:C-type lectin domain-containing protein n=1 Tax=Patella caerulea TaxID=87958 RepID=A0AAN8KA62_PATCE
MFYRNNSIILFFVFISKSVGNNITQLSANKQVCKVPESAVDNNVVIRTWFSRSFLNCVIECSQETMCQSVFFDKSSRLCYWNNNIPVTITTTTTCGSLLYLQFTETGLDSECCSSNNSLTVTVQPSSSTVQTGDTTDSTPDLEVTEPSSTTTEATLFTLLPTSGIWIYLEYLQPKRHTSASYTCGQNSGRLVVIDTQIKQNDVQNFLLNSGVGDAYIGLTKLLAWKWSDGSSVGYENWSATPGLFQGCAVMDSSQGYQWKGVSCLESHPYLCEQN